jgi:thiol:disulfide interchange protein DsbD
MFSRTILFGIFAALTAGLSWSASAAEGPAVASAHTVASLVSADDTVAVGHPIQLALRLRIAPGWHTYWRNPGDAGVAPEMTWAKAPGDVGPIQWPLPSRISEGTLTTFGYTGDVLLPVSATPAAVPLMLRAHATWLVCRDLCVPEEADLKLELPAGPPTPAPQATLFATAAAHTPVPASFEATIAPDGMLTLSGTGLPPDTTTAEFFPAADGATEPAGRQPVVQSGDSLTVHLDTSSAFKPTASLQGVVALTDAHGLQRAFDVLVRPGAAQAPAEPLLLLLLLALGGGLLLNLMPCVFPVLAMKAIGLARLSGSDRQRIRGEAGSYVAGVIAAFTMLGLALMGLRAAGQAAGWGFQFQSPVFVTVIAWLLFATGLNMSGVFSVGESLAGTGQALANRRGHLGSFFTGVLAVLVATPCTASFMGAAIAGALAAPAAVTALVFATMGLGLALPYAAVATVPHVASLLPRPGRWMVTLRQLLAFPMYGAAAWLVWVASQQSGPSGVLTAVSGIVLVGFAAWAVGMSQAGAGRWRQSCYAAAIAAGLAAAALLPGASGAGPQFSEPYTAARLAELRSEGRPVFVNMTAAWCISCLVNERLALSPQAVRDAFARSHVAYLKGDWTRQDPAISRFLREHGRDGVPLYIFYPPGAPPSVLPQLLTEGTVLDQIAAAHSGS